MSGGSKRFSLNEMDAEEEVVVPKTTLVARAPEPEASSVAEFPPVQEREEAPPRAQNRNGSKARLLAEQRFKPVEAKRQTSIRLEPWLDQALDRRFYELKMDGYKKITREAIITDALVQYLGVKPPKE